MPAFIHPSARTLSLSLAILYLFCLQLSCALTAPRAICSTNRYVNVSTIAINTGLYLGSATKIVNPHQFTFTFSYPQVNTSYHMGISINEMNYIFPQSKALNYSVDTVSKTTTAIPLVFYTNNANKISIMVVDLCITQPGFLDLSFFYFWIDFGFTFNSGQFKSSNFNSLDPTTNAGASVYSTIIGLDAVTLDTTFEIGFSVSVALTGLTTCKVTVTSLSAKSVTLNAIYVLAFIYNNVDLATGTPVGKYTYGAYSATNGNNAGLRWTDTMGGAVRKYNAFIGLRSFYIKGDNAFNYKSYVDDSIAVASNSTNNWISLGFNFIVYQFFYCTDPTPYYLAAQNICYDICPIRYSQNTQYFECIACPTVDCYTCGMDGKCLTCNETADYRYMDNATMRCLPLPGYYSNAVSQAVPCNPANCLTCKNSTICVTCTTGKYLTSSKTCISCIANCFNCTTATNCQVCADLYIFSVNACIPNCSNITYCSTCSVASSLLLCSACSLGYQLSNNTCLSVCGDGVLISPQACDDNNTANGDGCSSTCAIQLTYYCSTAISPSSCAHCISDCDNCSNNATCTVCSLGYTLVSGICSLDCTVVNNCSSCFYNTTTSSTECTACQVGYSIAGANNCSSTCGDGIRVGAEECDDGGSSSGDGCSSNCSIETSYFCSDTFPNASNCSKCIDFCSLCSNNYTCTNCSTNYAFDVTIPACVIDCTVVGNCSTCFYNATTATTECATCLVGYSIIGVNNCSTVCGDGIRTGNQACDDGGNSSGDGCSSDCLLEPTYFCNDTFPNASNCSKCMPFCDVCTDNYTCTNCSVDYAFDSSVAACVIDCSPIALCTVCSVVSSNLSCNQCVQGYSAISNLCQTVCGDGFRVGNESCDDNNTANSDGCAANCTVEVGFFCSYNTSMSSNQSVCSSCISFCLLCSDNASCTQCKPNYIYLTANNTCFVDCSNISLCSSCSFASSLICQQCILGYKVSANICISDCGDGIVVTEEECDDGNKISNDGCSSSCVLQPKFNCANSTVNGSLMTQCSPCMANCNNCLTSVLDCDFCSPLYLYTLDAAGNVSCLIDCSHYPDCKSCDITKCTSCIQGFGLGSSYLCTPICGDGVEMNGEECDDNNTADSDGCSATCVVEDNFVCTTVNQLSVCSLLSAAISYVGVTKVSASNTIQIVYNVSPKDLPAFSSLEWKTVVAEQSNLGLTVTAVTFDPSTGAVTFTADYAQSLNDQTAQLSFQFPPTAPFNLLNATAVSVKLTTDNNLSLEVYSEEEYGSAALVKTAATAASLLGLAMFLFGAFAGKLIGIELIAVFQVSFLSLTTLEDLSPSFESLSALGYSCGFAVKGVQPSQATVGRRFNPLSLKAPFLENYNVTAAVIAIPLFLSLIFWLVNRLKFAGKNERLQRYSARCKGEICFYGMMFSAYTVVVALAIDALSSQPEFTGIGIGAVLVIALLLFAVLLHKYPVMFGEFREKFNSERVIQSHFYCFLIAERILSAAILAASPFEPTQAVVIGVYALQTGAVLIAKPYKGDRAWLRPFLNLLISILIELIYLLTPQLGPSMKPYAVYAPFAIIGLLMVAASYSAYFFVKEIMAAKAEAAQSPLMEQQNFMRGERAKLQMFKQTLCSNLNQSFQSHLSDLDSPIKIISHEGIASLKEQLNKSKIAHQPPTPVYFTMNNQTMLLQEDLI